MWNKGLLIAVGALLLAQSICAANGEDGNEDHASNRVIVQIENIITYYVYTTEIGFSSEDAKALCESMNMTLVRFDTKGEWLSMSKWLADSPYSNFWFWMGAIRDAGNSTWYWEKTGTEIIDFFWGPDQPSMDNAEQACMHFNYDLGGWNDIECVGLEDHAMCVNK